MKKVHIAKVLSTAGSFAKNAMKQPLISPAECRKRVFNKGGVYLVYYGVAENIIYVGRATNLKRRICNNHLSARKSSKTSVLRRMVNKRYGISVGKEMREWFFKNCKFSFLEVNNSDIRGVVEYLLIAACRSKLLLNQTKG